MQSRISQEAGLMSVLSRRIPLVALLCGLGAPSLSAQSLHRSDDFRWYVGGQAGFFIYTTPTQIRARTLLVAAPTLPKAPRPCLLLEADKILQQDKTLSP